MKRTFITTLALALTAIAIVAQTPQQPAANQPGTQQEEVIRISTALVQTNVVVTDRNDRIVPDLKLEDFELYENGRKQELKFLEFVGVDTGRRTEGTRPSLPVNVEPEAATGVSAKDLKRVMAFVIDDLTIPYQDLPVIRELLQDFVNNKMQEGDLVAIFRVGGGKGLLQQFTSDRQLLRRAIAAITITVHPFSAFNNPSQTRQSGNPVRVDAAASETGDTPNSDLGDVGIQDISGANDDVNRLFRGLFALSTANQVIDSLRQIPGHKNMVIISSGIPLFESGSSGSNYSNVSYMLNRLSDNAIRSGVTVNTLDPRGLRATPGVVGFSDTPTRSALGGGDPTFGRGGSGAGRVDVVVGQGGAPPPGSDDIFGIAGVPGNLGLSSVAAATGGVSVINTNDFESGLNKVLARSSGYYTLAYTPTERFDNKFHKLEVRVKRSGTKVFNALGFVAREDAKVAGTRSKEEAIVAAALSPLAKRDLDVTPNVAIKLVPGSKAAGVDVHMLIDPKKLRFTDTADGRKQTSLDVVGFVYDQLGRRLGGISETINLNLTPENYQRGMQEGLTYSASIPPLQPGYYQVRVVVREAGTGSLGTFSRYMEIPNLANGRLAMSSLFLFSLDSRSGTNPVPLLAARQLTRSQELRYAATIYNAKLRDGKPQLTSQMFITQGNKVLFREPEQPVVSSSVSPVVKVGQLGLARVPPGKYVLTLVITDQLADKKSQTLSRSLDFNVVP